MKYDIRKIENLEEAKMLILNIELSSERINKEDENLYNEIFNDYFYNDFINCGGILLGAFFEDKLLGVIGYIENHIEYLYVLPKYQKMKIGKNLLYKALENLRDFSHLTLNSTEESYLFYKKNGFDYDGICQSHKNFKTYHMKYLTKEK